MKYAFVTGADRGLGFHLALELLRRGYDVFAGRYMKDWDEWKTDPDEWRSRLTLLDLDASDGDSVEAAAQAVSARTDSLELLVNNAGIATDLDS